MDERRKHIEQAYAEFEAKIADLQERQTKAIRAFGERAAEMRIKQIRNDIGYARDRSGSESGEN